MSGLRDEERAGFMSEVEELKKDPRAGAAEKCIMELLQSILILDERLSKIEEKLVENALDKKAGSNPD